MPDTRTWLALIISGFAILGTTALSITVITTGSSDSEKINQRTSLVFNSTLPLFATWVGTVLAYYFARENFESASRSTERFAQLSIQASSSDLQSIPVSAAMIPISKMYTELITANIVDVLKKMDEKEQRRLPILDSETKPINLFYYEDITRFYYSKLDADRAGLTLQSYLGDETTNKKQFALVDSEANLALAKEAMKKIPECRDIFVTNVTGKVIGFLTNVDIEKFSKV